jgi:Mor family transcriptional regulator
MVGTPVSNTDHLAPAFKADLIAHAVSLLQSNGLPTDEATLIAHKLADHMGFIWGGINVYFPKDYRKQIDARDQLIYAEFNGKNHSELAMKHKITVQQVYKIVERVRAADIASRQTSLEL